MVFQRVVPADPGDGGGPADLAVPEPEAAGEDGLQGPLRHPLHRLLRLLPGGPGAGVPAVDGPGQPPGQGHHERRPGALQPEGESATKVSAVVQWDTALIPWGLLSSSFSFMSYLFVFVV